MTTDETLAPAPVPPDGEAPPSTISEVRMGAVGQVRADRVVVEQGAIGSARADSVSAERSALGNVMAGDVRVSQGLVGSVLAKDVHLDQVAVRTVVAQNVTIGRGSALAVLVAQRVEGDVRVLLDWRGALAFGAAFGLVAGLVRRARNGKG